MPDETPLPPGKVRTIVAWVVVAWMALNTHRGCESSERLSRIERQQAELRALVEQRLPPAKPPDP